MNKSELEGPRYWRSLDELAEKPEFKEWVHREFPQGASELEGVNRRSFLRIMSASFAVAGVGLAGCRRPEQHILPYSRQDGSGAPESVIPGLPVHYATSFPDENDHLPLIVETHSNRPTHIEGNPDYEPYGGSTNGIAQASVLDLYDPDRMQAASRGARTVSRGAVSDALKTISSKFGSNKGAGLAVLAAPSASPTRAKLVKQLKQAYPQMIWAEYAPISKDAGERGATAVFGAPVRPIYDLKGAKRILAIDADFLNKEAASNGLARAFARGRKVQDKADAKQMNRLYSVESNFTLSGAMADHRLRLGTSEMAAFTVQFALAVLKQLGGHRDLVEALEAKSAQSSGDAEWIAECAKDLIAHRGHSVVLAGNHLPVEVQALVVLVNELLGANGHTVSYVAVEAKTAAPIGDLATAINGGKVATLVILGGNPVYNAPADLNFGGLIKKVPEVVRYGYHYDETSVESGLNVAASHYLESWSDGRTYDGTYVPVQPMILPLFDSWSELEFLATLGGLAERDAYELVLNTHEELTSGQNFEKFLSVGFNETTTFKKATGSINWAGAVKVIVSGRFPSAVLTANNLEVRLIKDDSVGDGTYANNGWLQECPDPMTKLAWDNAILVSPKLAKEVLKFDTKSGKFLIQGIAKKPQVMKSGREIAPVAEVSINGVTVRGPVHIQPGLADWSIILPLGYGRSQVGRVGKDAGFNAYPLSTSKGFYQTGVSIRMTQDEARLANTQEHWSMEGRAIIREANAEHHASHPDWVKHMGMESHSPAIYGTDKDMSLAEKSLTTPRGGSLYETPNFDEPLPNVDAWKSDEAKAKFIPEQQWGMSIDLNTCTGCNACVIACQSENNIPIVGREQVMRGREMHWIRLDRYYSSGDVEENRVSLPADPQASIMPVGCMHCEMAPCEQVCPVNATVHDSMGLNVMAYNRCVGTRYCANNCPYKVRRFNFFDYNKREPGEHYLGPLGTNKNKTEAGTLKAMQANPDVTVRMRGVMEKCTYCVQRIQSTKIAQKVKAKDSNNVHIPDGILKVACQTACPTEAIVFGDISNPESAVSKAKANDRDYALLGYLNVRPRTTYLGRLRNPNPSMPDYHKLALSRMEYERLQGHYPEGGHGAEGSHGGHEETEHATESHDSHGHG